jgi:hypothetical protein
VVAVFLAVKEEVSREGQEGALEEVLQVEQGDLGEEVRSVTGKNRLTTLGQWEFSWV